MALAEETPNLEQWAELQDGIVLQNGAAIRDDSPIREGRFSSLGFSQRSSSQTLSWGHVKHLGKTKRATAYVFHGGRATMFLRQHIAERRGRISFRGYHFSLGGREKLGVKMKRKLRVLLKRKTTKTTIDYDDPLEAFIHNSIDYTADIDNRSKLSGMLRPEGVFRVRWDLMISITVFFYMLVIPMRVAFFDTCNEPFVQSSGSWYGLDLVLDCVFIVDLGLNFFTAQKHEGELITDRRRVAVRYLRTWFILDVAACFPATIMEEYFSLQTKVSDGGQNKLLRLTRLMKATKLLRAVRIPKFFKRVIANLALNPGIVRLLKMVTFMIFMWHNIACVYWKIASDNGFCELDSVMAGDREAGDPFYEVSNAYNGFQECTHSWAPWRQIAHMDFHGQYSHSFYWAIMATTGIGRDVNPQSDVETVFTVLVITVGVLMYASMVGTLNRVLQANDTSVALRKEKSDKTESFLRLQRMPYYLLEAVRDYFGYRTTHCAGMDFEAVFDDLPVLLTVRLKIAMYRSRIESVPFFCGLPEEIVVGLVNQLKQIIALPGEYLANQGEMGRRMFIIQSGKVHLTMHFKNRVLSEDDQWRLGIAQALGKKIGLKGARDASATGFHKLILGDSGVVVNVLADGDYFGELSIVREQHHTSAVTSSFCDLLTLATAGFVFITKRFPKVAKMINEASKLRSEGMETVVRQTEEKLRNMRFRDSLTRGKSTIQPALRKKGEPPSTQLRPRKGAVSDVACSEEVTEEVSASESSEGGEGTPSRVINVSRRKKRRGSVTDVTSEIYWRRVSSTVGEKGLSEAPVDGGLSKAPLVDYDNDDDDDDVDDSTNEAAEGKGGTADTALNVLLRKGRYSCNKGLMRTPEVDLEDKGEIEHEFIKDIEVKAHEQKQCLTNIKSRLVDMREQDVVLKQQRDSDFMLIQQEVDERRKCMETLSAMEIDISSMDNDTSSDEDLDVWDEDAGYYSSEEEF